MLLCVAVVVADGTVDDDAIGAAEADVIAATFDSPLGLEEA